MSPPLLPQDITMTSETGVERDMAGETLCGFRVAAWRETHPEHGDKFGHSYSEHWSTPSQNPDVKVERLFTETQLLAALSRAPEAGREGAAERLAIVAEKPAHLIRWGEGDRLDLQSVLAALSPPSTGGEGEDWDRIPRAKRFGRRLNESAVKHLAPGTLLRFYSEDPWFDPSPSSPANGDIVIFTGAVSNTFPKVGPHLEVRTLGGRVYPGGGWVYQIFQFVADPSPEMGEISREEWCRLIHEQLGDGDADSMMHRPAQKSWEEPSQRRWEQWGELAEAIEAKLKENGLSREGLGDLARSQPGTAGPSDCAEAGQPLSDGGRD